MATKIIRKSVLGELGLSQNVHVIGDSFEEQLLKVCSSLQLPSPEINMIAMTAMTGFAEREATNNEYFPKIRQIGENLDAVYQLLMPKVIYNACKAGLDKFRPGCDFIVWDKNKCPGLAAITFSREAPILAFESTTGSKALGVILRPSLMKYGDYLFSSIKEALKGTITVEMVCGTHYNYPEGSIPAIVYELAKDYDMYCLIGIDSERSPECYHRGEKGNHVVVMW